MALGLHKDTEKVKYFLNFIKAHREPCEHEDGCLRAKARGWDRSVPHSPQKELVLLTPAPWPLDS